MLTGGHITLVAGNPTQNPNGIAGRTDPVRSFDDLKSGSTRQGIARHRLEPLDGPPTGACSDERHDPLRHMATLQPPVGEMALRPCYNLSPPRPTPLTLERRR